MWSSLNIDKKARACTTSWRVEHRKEKQNKPGLGRRKKKRPQLLWNSIGFSWRIGRRRQRFIITSMLRSRKDKWRVSFRKGTPIQTRAHISFLSYFYFCVAFFFESPLHGIYSIYSIYLYWICTFSRNCSAL